MSSEKNPYKLLGVPENASLEDIKSAYRKIARRLHPDVNSDNPAAEIQFQDISAAHELLTNPARKSSYDLALMKRKSVDSEYFFYLPSDQ